MKRRYLFASATIAFLLLSFAFVMQARLTDAQSTFCPTSCNNGGVASPIGGASLCYQTLPNGAATPSAIDAGICICPADLTNQVSGASSLIADNGQSCYYYNESVIVTYYPSAGNAELLNQLGGQDFLNSLFGSQSLSVPVPVISSILSYNNQESPSLITCPSPVDFENTVEYFYQPGTFMGGNRCLQNSLPLITPVHYNNQVSFATLPFMVSTLFGLAPVTDKASYEINCNLIPSSGAQSCGTSFSQSSLSSSIQNILNPLINNFMTSLAGSSSQSLLQIGLANGTVNTLAFSGQTTLENPNTKSLSAYNISSAYNTQSYIFQNINGTQQQALWTWSAKYADLSSTDLGYLNIDKTINNLHSTYTGLDFVYCQVAQFPIIIPVGYSCNMEYSYTLHSYVTTLQNSEVQIPIFNTGSQNLNILDVGNYKYQGTYESSLSGVSSSCQTQMLEGGPGCDGWIKVSLNGTYITSKTDLGGTIFQDLPVYAKSVSGAPRGAPGIIDYTLLLTESNGYCGGSQEPQISIALPTSIVQLYTVQDNFPAFVSAVDNLLYSDTGMQFYVCQNGNPGPFSLQNGAFQWKYGDNGGYGSGWAQVTPNYLPIVDYVAPAGLSAQLNGRGQGFVFAQDTSPGVKFNGVQIVPVLTDNFQLPTPYTEGSVPGYTNLTYEIYSPNNFAGASGATYSSASEATSCGPANRACIVTPIGYKTSVSPQVTGVEPFNLYTGGGFLATYSTKDNVPGNLIAFATDNFNSPLIYPGYLSNFLAVYGGESAGDSSLTALQSVPSVSYLTSAPDGSIYAIQLLSDTSVIPKFNWLATSALNIIGQGALSIFLTTQMSTVTNSLLIKLNYVPTGDLLSPGPGSISPVESGNPSQSSTAQLSTTWNAMSEYYFEESLLYHTPELAITGFTILSSTTTAQSIWGNIFGSNPAATATQGTDSQKITLGQPFIALGAVTDTAGDLFLVGSHIQGEPAHSFGLAVIPVNGVANIDDKVFANVESQSSPLESPTEIAVAPTGQYVFVANSSSPYIYIFNVKSGFAPESSIPLIYGNSTWTLDITKYLANGGPYYGGEVRSFYSELGSPSLSSVNWGGNRENILDTAANHHPIAISDSQGILYVLDNWTLPDNGNSNEASAIWMLRAFTQNGVEVQIDGNANDTLSYTGTPHGQTSQSSQQYSAIQSTLLDPPYGWPLAANISTDWPSSYGPLPQHVTFCAADCMNPGSGSNYLAYPPVGPAISGEGTVGPYPDDIGITTDYQGNIYMMMHVYITQYSEWKHILSFGFSNGQESGFAYAEMLVLHPSIQNYTRTSDGSYSNYTCLITPSPSAPNPVAGIQSLPTGTVLMGSVGPQQICNYAPPSVNLINIYPPILPVPDSLGYLESLGTPATYLNAPGLVGSFIPSGLSSNSASANSLFNNGVSGANSLNYNSLFNTASTSQGTPVPSGRTYLTSNISGSVMVPYHIIYTVDQSWKGLDNPGTVVATIPPGGTNTSPPPLSCSGEVLMFQPACSFPDPSSSSQSVNLYTYQLVPLQDQGALNETVEGGNIYVNDNIFRAPYQANLSDAGLIELPVQDYSIFADKIIGEIYINRTVTPSEFETSAGLNYANYLTGGKISASSIPGLSQLVNIFTSPQVINASNGYTYSIIPFLQIPISARSNNPTSYLSPSSIIPGYLSQVAIPYGSNPNDTMLKANCGTSCDLGGSSILSNFLSAYSNIDTVGGGQLLSSALQSLNYYYSIIPTSLHIYSGQSNLTLNISDSTRYYDLYSLFKRGSYTYNLTLSLPGKDILGYNRLLYTYVDRFNNTVMMPVDVDFSNITNIQANATTLIDPTNYNQTQVTITGVATSVGLGGTKPMSGANIYLYYDTNLNYLNLSLLNKIGAGSLPSSAVQAACLASGTPGLSSVESSLGISESSLTNLQNLDPSYTKYATDCAYAVNSIGCVLANPLDCGSSNTLINTAQLVESQPVTYAPDYKAGSNSCIPPPNSLLALPAYDCNIYGKPLPGAFQGESVIGDIASQLGVPQGQVIPTDELPSYAIGPNGPMYCVPEFLNGTGVFTSQLGMITTVQTNSQGAFSYTFNACGTSQNKVIAEYYGNPPPQPLYGQQPNLENSASAKLLQSSLLTSPEYNYYDSPNYTITTFQNGSALLELGNIYAWAPIIIILILILAARASTGQGGTIFQYMGFASLTNIASGIGSGKAGRRLKKTDYGRSKGVIEQHSFGDPVKSVKNVRDEAKNLKESYNAYKEAKAKALPEPKKVRMAVSGNMYQRIKRNVKDFNEEMGAYSRDLASRPGAVTMGQFARNYRLDPIRLKWVPRKNVKYQPGQNPAGAGVAIMPIGPAATPRPGGQNPSDPGRENTPTPPVEPNDPYAVLGISPNATIDEVKAAYRAKVKQFHPDANPDPGAADKFKEATKAYEEIKRRMGL